MLSISGLGLLLSWLASSHNFLRFELILDHDLLSRFGGIVLWGSFPIIIRLLRLRLLGDLLPHNDRVVTEEEIQGLIVIRTE